MFLPGSSFRISPRSSRRQWRISLISLRKEHLWILRSMSWSSLSRLCSQIHRLGQRPYKNCSVDAVLWVIGRTSSGLNRDLFACHTFKLLSITFVPWNDITTCVPLLHRTSYVWPCPVAKRSQTLRIGLVAYWSLSEQVGFDWAISKCYPHFRSDESGEGYTGVRFRGSSGSTAGVVVFFRPFSRERAPIHCLLPLMGLWPVLHIMVYRNDPRCKCPICGRSHRKKKQSCVWKRSRFTYF